MPLSIFPDKSVPPTEEALADALGDAKRPWDEIKAFCADRYSPITEEWFFSGAKYGWAFRLKHKKRVILYFTPQDRYFYNGFVLGDKAIDSARVSGLSPEIMDIINNAPKYGEGTGFRIEIRDDEYIGDIKTLIGIKMGN